MPDDIWLRQHSMRLYPGARVRLNVAWIQGEHRFVQGAPGVIRGWGRDNRPQVEFEETPGLFVPVDEAALRIA